MVHRRQAQFEAGEARPATRVVLTPAGDGVQMEAASFAPDLVRKALLDKPITAGEVVGPTEARAEPGVAVSPVKLKVVSTTPDGLVKVDHETRIELHDREAKATAASGVDAMYDDVRILRPILGQIREMIELPLRRPELFAQMGISPPRGVLVRGLPTAGTARLARAVAEEIHAELFRVTGVELMAMTPDAAEQRLQAVFEQASSAKRAIVLIEDVDAIARRRDWTVTDAERRVGARLLELMDHLKPDGDLVVVALAYREEALDNGLRRPGRFDREIVVGIPDQAARCEFLSIALAGKPLAADVDLHELAELTWGYAVADLGSFVREAALQALRRTCPVDAPEPEACGAAAVPPAITHDDFLEAMKRVRPSALHEIVVQTPTTTWDDVGAYEAVKERLRKGLVLPMTKPEALARLGVRPVHGFLLFGPPGNGKALLCAAAAKEAGASLLIAGVSELLFKGRRVQELIVSLFARAREVAPAVIFIDEVDRLTSRGGDDPAASREALNALIAELDALGTAPGIMVVGSTTRPSILEPDLIRGGRLVELIYVPAPDRKARLHILRIATRDTPLAEDVDLGSVAEQTERFTGADLVALVRAAGLAALHRDVDMVDAAAFREALYETSPSVTPEMEDAYEETAVTLKQEPARRPGIGFALPTATAEEDD